MKRLALIVATLISACGWQPAYNPQSAEWPCGPRGVVCSGSYGSASCCWQGDVCGSGEPWTTCPAGYCCSEGDDRIGESRPLRMQWVSGH